MATAALTITSSWAQAASGPASVLIPAKSNFHWAITDGSAPVVLASLCALVERGNNLSLELATGESLQVIAPVPFDTSVTTGA